MELTLNEFKERTGTGLRNMQLKPDYLIILVTMFEDWEYDQKSFSNIPIIKTNISENNGYGGYDYPILPGFNSDIPKDIVQREVYFFQRGFHENNYNSF